MRFERTLKVFSLTCLLTLASLVLLIPILIYKQGTFSEASVALVSSPYVESNVLKYVWSGYIHQSCAIVIDRYLVTSENVVITLKSSPLLDPLENAELGPANFTLSVETPSGMPEPALPRGL